MGLGSIEERIRDIQATYPGLKNDVRLCPGGPALTHADLDVIVLDEVQRRFDLITADWPYDDSVEMTDEQLKEQGAVDRTNDVNGMNIMFGLGRKRNQRAN